MRSRLFPLIVFFVWQLLLQPVATAADISISADIKKQVLNKSLDYLFDAKQQYKLSDVLHSDAQLKWIDGKDRPNSLIMPPGRYWIKGSLYNSSDKAFRITLQLEYPNLNEAQLYLVDEQGELQTLFTRAGTAHPFNNRVLPHRTLLADLTLKPKADYTLVWKITSEPLFHVSITAWNPSTFYDQDQRNQIFYGMIYGTLIVMMLYNLFLFFACKNNSYLFYVLFIGTAFYLMSAEQGHTYQYIKPDSDWPKQLVYTTFYILNILMFAQFTVSFLNVGKHSKPLQYTLYGLATITALSIAILATTSQQTFALITFISSTLLLFVALLTGILVRKAGVVSAGHFVIAIMILVFAVTASQMSNLGLIESNSLTQHLPAVGTTLMLVFFSLALADRINQLQKENTEASQAIMQAIEQKQKTDTELQRSRQERIKLEQMAASARHESQAKSSFLATMSHEIRNPMDNVLNMAETMKHTAMDEQQAQLLNNIERSSHSLLAIINDLQDFAKIEAGEMTLEVSSFNLETLLDDCISTFSLRSIEKQINFIADLQPSIPPVLIGDATKLRQIVINLLSNAFKFTDQGDILVKVKSTDKPAFNSIELQFEVSDSGIGLTEAERERLFTPFHQAQDGDGRYGGSGLGLSISKQLAELMDGHIGVSSVPGKGSTFWFTARLLIDKHPDASLLREKSTLLAGKRLLLVDPNPISADIIRRLLVSWRMDVVVSTQLFEAKQALANQSFDIVLAEFHLENGNSLTIAELLRDKGLDHTHFILMAASRHVQKHSDMDDYDINILLEKPITNALLHDALLRALSANHPNAKAIPTLQVNAAELSVLVVEDNQVNQLVIQGLLKQLDISPSLALNGLEAVNKVEHQHYDLILMDCEMPEMDGYEASHQIRVKEAHMDRPKTAIIALSAHARSDYKTQANTAGMDEYLTKPISLSDLVNIMNKVLTTKEDETPNQLNVKK